MGVSLYEWDKNEKGWAWIEVTANKVVNLLLRAENNLIKIDENNDVYTDLQLEDGISTTDTLPVGVTTGRVLQADWWVATWTMLSFKTTSWDYVTWIYWDDGKLYIDNWTWTFKQIYLKSEVDALFTQLRSEISAVGFSGEYDDLLNKPTLWTAAALDVWTNAWDIPVLDANWKLDNNIVPSTWVMTSYTVTNKSDLTTLSSAVKWDIWIVTSENKTYILSNEPYSTLSNWTELLFPTGSVSSVNWFTWAVNLTTGYITESNNNLFVSAAEKALWNNKLWTNDVATVATTGSFTDLNNKPVVDTAMSSSSTNAVQNKIIKAYVDSTAWSSAAGVISDTAYGSSWDGDTTHAPSKNAIYDEVNTINTSISNIQSDITDIQSDITDIQGDITTMQWDITDLQTAVSGGISDAAFSSTWDGDTTHAPSKNAIYDVLGDVETLLANL